MKISCINLDRRPDRWSRMEQVARAAGVELERIAAVDAAAANFAELSRHMLRDGPTGRMSDRTVACTLSHFKAWRSFLDDPDRPEYLVVLEDDVELSHDFRAVIEEIAARKMLGHDIVKLELGGTMKDGVVIAEGAGITGGRRVCPVFQLVTETGAYMLSRASARRLVAFETAIRVPIDHFLFYPVRRRGFWAGKCGVVVSAVARQDRSITSDIAPQRHVGGALRRETRRALYEAAQLPTILRGMIRDGARVRRVSYDAGDPGGIEGPAPQSGASM